MNKAEPTITKDSFGKTEEGITVYLWTLKNKNGITAKITNYGGIVTSLFVPDKKGRYDDIVLGYDKLGDYIKDNSTYIGATIGRFAGRIANARFVLDSKEYNLAKNNNSNNLHGGIKGFNKVVWEAEEIKNENETRLKFSYLSKDGEEGFPGNLRVTVTYKLNDNDELSINYEAKTDKPTPVNLTHHSYFNLTGGRRDILEHEVTINGDKYMVTDKNLIPSGEIKSVEDTPLDFRTPHKVGERIAKVEVGYDNTYDIIGYNGKLLLAGKVYEAESGRKIEVYTTEPELQFYTGNFLDGTITGKNNIVYKKHFGLCLETQHYPDSPNHSKFPSTILKPGDKYEHLCLYRFSVKE
jgi:aldose 1-epimerase